MNANRCEVCAGNPNWRFDRKGDAVVSWACNDHLLEVLMNLQRDWEDTQITVRRFE